MHYYIKLSASASVSAVENEMEYARAEKITG